MFPLKPYTYIEIAALICSLIWYKNLRESHFKWLTLFLLLMVCTELIGRYMRKVLLIPNTPLYNITIPIEYAFYAFTFYKFALSTQLKKIHLIGLLFILIFSIVNLLFIQDFYLLATNNLKVGNILMIVLSCLAFIDVFKNDLQTKIIKNPLFWIATGVLIFNAGELLYVLFFDTLLKLDWDKTAKVFGMINNNLIYILYGSIIISILCTRNLQRKNY